MPSAAAQWKALRKRIKAFFKLPVTIPRNMVFAYRHRHLREQRKIIYSITPPPRWKDIGDHAQVVAIDAWLAKHYPDIPILEMDKDRARYYLPALKWLTGPDDLILLHSGGNMGDRAMWSEGIRRLLIQSFPDNQIASLPQTIFFSETPRGKREYENTRRIYAQHPDLLIVARDPLSLETARTMFPHARTDCMPDFVLSLEPAPVADKSDDHTPQVLLVLRSDNEAFITPEQRAAISTMLPYPCAYFDTVTEKPILESEREAVVERCLNTFRDADVVVTDRFHGLIFSVITRTPCVALRSIDHKIIAGRHWFGEVPFIRFAERVEDIPRFVEELRSVTDRTIPDYNRLYFDRLPEVIGWPPDTPADGADPTSPADTCGSG